MTSARPVLITVDEARGGAFYHLRLDGYADWPASGLGLASPHFILLIIADATAAEKDAERAAARRAIKQGLVFMCAWGPGCEHIEETFDWAFLELPDAQALPVLMTTQHSGESLDDAVEFFPTSPGRTRPTERPADPGSSQRSAPSALRVGARTWSDASSLSRSGRAARHAMTSWARHPPSLARFPARARPTLSPTVRRVAPMSVEGAVSGGAPLPPAQLPWTRSARRRRRLCPNNHGHVITRGEACP
jgi:hypothetical protein